MRRKLLDPSELGTKEYWDTVYAREIDNHEQDGEDEGTIWFSESNAEEAVLKLLGQLEDRGLLTRNASPGQDAHGHTGSKSCPSPSRFLDLGTGNGHMLFALREEEEDGKCWSGDVVGVDYSEASVQLAERIAAQKQVEDASSGSFQFERWDILSDPPGSWLMDGFDVVLDKGTFDAISLMQHFGNSPHPCEIYRSKVIPVIKPGCFLLVTSCNWTRDELTDWLAPEGEGLIFYCEANYPKFTFGGHTGQSIVTVVFQKRDR